MSDEITTEILLPVGAAKPCHDGKSPQGFAAPTGGSTMMVKTKVLAANPRP
jgi:hypothetical protein